MPLYGSISDMLILYTSLDIDTECLGRLTFATISTDSLVAASKSFGKIEDDRKAYLHILHGYLIEPKVSVEDLGLLSEEVLEAIGRELLEKSYLTDMLDETKVKKKTFFFAFRDTLNKIIDAKRKSLDRWTQLANSFSDRARINAQYYQNAAVLSQINYAKKTSEQFLGTYSVRINEIERALREQTQTVQSLAKNFSERRSDLTNIMKSPMLDLLSVMTQPAEAIRSANLAIAEILERAGHAYDIAAVRASNLEAIETNLKNVAISRITHIPQYAVIGEISLAAERMIAGVRWQDIENVFSIYPKQLNVLEASFRGFTRSYSELYCDIEKSKGDISSFDWFITELPPLEVYTGAKLANHVANRDAVKVEIDSPRLQYLMDEIADSLERELTKIEPELVRVWRGAKQALQSTNPDRFRHVTVSLRELLTQVLHKIAPDEEILKWTSDSSNFHNGYPTRAARLRFVCRKIDHGPFALFVRKDVEAHLSFLDVFQRGTHELTVSFTQEQVECLLLRAEALLRFLLLVSGYN